MNLATLGVGPQEIWDGLAYFRIRAIGDRFLLTNVEGRWVLLSQEELGRALRGSVEPGDDLFEQLRRENFLRDHYDVPRAASEVFARKKFLGSGPNLHILVITLRCNETCVYCHASRAPMDALDTDMSRETAEQAIDVIFRSPSPFLTIEFQGGEPLVNFEVVQHAIAYALEKNKTAQKQLEFTMVSNFALMTEEKLAYLVDHKVQLCTSIDGPKGLHDKQRKLPTASAHDAATHWIRTINQAYTSAGLDPTLYHVEALLTTTRSTLPLWKEVVDTYLELGCRALFLRPIDPFGFAAKTAPKVEYPREAYLEFYAQAVDYMLELNKGGEQILERYAAIFLTKILSREDPNFLDIRWPAGAGLGQLAYNYDGRIFTCDEGRMLHEMGDSTFEIGHVKDTKYRELVSHPTVRSVVLASHMDQQPDCEGCTYQPYCGVPPVHTYKTQGSLFGSMRESSLCQVHKGIQDYLFGKLAEGDASTLETFRRWTTNRPRDHFVHE